MAQSKGNLPAQFIAAERKLEASIKKMIDESYKRLREENEREDATKIAELRAWRQATESHC